MAHGGRLLGAAYKAVLGFEFWVLGAVKKDERRTSNIELNGVRG